jgi:alginate O-acetyltransferase complex protein AlgI
MLFNSIHFIFFFVIVTTLYFIIPHKYRWALILIASSYFYMFFIPIYILILLFVITVDYFAGILIEKHTGFKRKAFLIMSLAANLGVLGFFKYFNFIGENISTIFNFLGITNHFVDLNIILPIGLSFHTFQAMSYTIEVYRGNYKAERHPGIYATYVMFYPQLVAGPIEKPQHLLPQLKSEHYFEDNRVSDGLKLMLIGFLKKLVIADRLAIYVNTIYGHYIHHSGISLLLATVFFSFQIYCDFSGYTDIARGAARVMGINLIENFRLPYLSRSITEFWRRWHISLSVWFRDYLFLPISYALTRKLHIANSKQKEIIIYGIAALITFFLCGLWHGANWTFVIWGLGHGILLLSSRIFKNTRIKIRKLFHLSSNSPLLTLFQIVFTFLVVTLLWVFFRSPNLAISMLVLNKIFTFSGPLFIGDNVDGSSFAYSIIVIIALVVYEIKMEFLPGRILIFNNPKLIVRLISIAFIIAVIFLLGVFDGSQFIYFQF